jgi:DNA-binding NarL/FixJ family response regulator
MINRRILIVDDHPLFRDALKQALSRNNLIVEEVGSLVAMSHRLAEEDNIDLVLLDLRMPGVQGLSGLALIRGQFPQTAVAIVSGVDDPRMVQTALALGASGFIAKSAASEDMRSAVDRIFAGEIWLSEDLASKLVPDPELADLARRMTSLTPQQMRVLIMVREGKLNKQIAFELDVSEATIKAHVSAILQKLNVDSRTQAVIAANRLEGTDTDRGHSAATATAN